MRPLKHLPLDRWPQADHAAFAAAYAPGDVFDESAGPGAHLADGTRAKLRTAWRRWLGFLDGRDPEALDLPPASRITPERVRAFIEAREGEVGASSLALGIADLVYAARLIAPDGDWAWLKAIARRLAARARPRDRFARLAPPVRTLDLGIALMDSAFDLPDPRRKRRELQYRDGLLLALLTCWPIRRRGLAALTVSRHVESTPDGIALLLDEADTKEKRAECFRVPERLVPYVRRYLDQVRPRLAGASGHDAFWASWRGRPLIAGRLYDIVRREVQAHCARDMGLHDFRRAAATFIAIEAPEAVGLIPGILQQASPGVGEKHYNLARTARASRRFAAHLDAARKALRPRAPLDED